MFGIDRGCDITDLSITSFYYYFNVYFSYWRVFVGVLSLSLSCLLYTSDAADDGRSVYIGGRRIIKKIFFF